MALLTFWCSQTCTRFLCNSCTVDTFDTNEPIVTLSSTLSLCQLLDTVETVELCKTPLEHNVCKEASGDASDV